MRETKFKAWHKIEKIMGTVDTITKDGCFVCGVAKGKDEYYDNGYMVVLAPEGGRFCPYKDIELIEYTGLKDKNGKEIYEGNIVKYTIITPQEQRLGGDREDITIDVVCFKNGMFGRYITLTHPSRKEFVPWANCREKELEVLGNVYENPKLLKL